MEVCRTGGCQGYHDRQQTWCRAGPLSRYFQALVAPPQSPHHGLRCNGAQVIADMKVQGLPRGSEEVGFGKVITSPLAQDRPLTVVQPQVGRPA